MMPGVRSEEERSAIKADAQKELKAVEREKGMKATLRNSSGEKRLDEATLRYLRDKKGGGADGGASRSIEHAPKTNEREAPSETTRQVEDIKKEHARVASETRSHQLDHYYRKQQERTR